MLCRAAYLAPHPSLDFAAAADDTATARLAEDRGRLLSDFVRGRNPVKVLDRIAAEVAPRPLVFVISSEDAAVHRGIVDTIFPTASRFRVVENSETLKVLAYEAPEAAAEPTEKKPSAPRIILTPGPSGTFRADTLGVVQPPPADSIADSTAVAPGPR